MVCPTLARSPRLNGLVPQKTEATLSCSMARQPGHSTGTSLSLVSLRWTHDSWPLSSPTGAPGPPLAVLFTDSQANTRWLAHSSPMSVYAGNQSTHVRTETHGAKGSGSRETKARTRWSRRCMGRSSRSRRINDKNSNCAGTMGKGGGVEEEQSSVSSLSSMNPSCQESKVTAYMDMTDRTPSQSITLTTSQSQLACACQCFFFYWNLFFFFSVRKLRASGRAPCAYYSNLRNAASPDKKRTSPSRHVTQPRDGHPFPWCSCSSPSSSGVGEW